MLTILDDPKEVMKGRHKELNSLKEMGAMSAVKRTTAVGIRVTQTRWVDREKDGCVKSRLVLKDITHSHGRMQTEMFAPTPFIYTVPENDAGHELITLKMTTLQ